MNQSPIRASELLKRIEATSYMNELSQNKLRMIRQVNEFCREADTNDVYGKCKPYGTVFNNIRIAKYFIKEVKKEIAIRSIKFDQSRFYCIDERSKLFNGYIRLLLESKIAEKIAISQYIEDPIITDVSLSISSSASYGADMWHRDGPLGKRIKIFLILHADPNYCCNLAYVPATYNLHAEALLIDHLPRLVSKERLLIDKNFEEQLKQISSNKIETTDYAKGDMFFFNTNMYHKRINHTANIQFNLVNRIALVAELISESRMKTFDTCRGGIPAGKYRIKVN